MSASMPLTVALSIIPSLPRPLLSRLVARAIERLDEMDGDTELEDDDPREQAWTERHSDFGIMGGFVLNTPNEDDEDGHDKEVEQGEAAGCHGIDQREVCHWGGAWREA